MKGHNMTWVSSPLLTLHLHSVGKIEIKKKTTKKQLLFVAHIAIVCLLVNNVLFFFSPHKTICVKEIPTGYECSINQVMLFFFKNSINAAPSMRTQPLFPLETAALKTSPVTNFCIYSFIEINNKKNTVTLNVKHKNEGLWALKEKKLYQHKWSWG